MNISPVSFRSTVGNTQRTDFTALISRPQAYAHMEQPTAATNLEGGKKKKSPIKTILGLIVAAGGIMAGLALCAKKGIFKVKSSDKEYVKIAKSGLKIAGDKCLEWGTKAIEVAKNKFGEAKNKFGEIKNKLTQSAVSDIAGDTIPVEEAIGDVAETLANL